MSELIDWDETARAFLCEARPSDLRDIWTFYLKASDGGMRAAFVIDGRQYTNPVDVRRDILEASREMEERRLLMETEVRPIEADAPESILPTWSRYKRQFLAGE